MGSCCPNRPGRDLRSDYPLGERRSAQGKLANNAFDLMSSGNKPAVTRPSKPANVPPGKRRWLRIAVLVLIYGGLLAIGQWGSGWLIEWVGIDLDPGVTSHARHAVMAAIALYTALMAVPFVPGLEISLALLAAFGAQVAVLIYAATMVALSLSFLIGRLLPMHLIATLFRSLGQHRAESLVRRLEPLDAAQRLETLVAHAPKRIVPVLLKHRYIAIAVALNVPGNAVIGGGGGIALLAGISGLFTFPRYLAVIALAVLPVPLTVMVMGG